MPFPPHGLARIARRAQSCEPTSAEGTMAQKLRTVLVDDEPLALDLLEAVLSDHPVVDVVGRCASGQDVLDLLPDARVDLMFLDVEMPGMSGMQVARAVSPPPMIVFATAHAEFAAEAFDADAVDYLLKPFGRERVLSAVEKAAAQRPYRLMRGRDQDRQADGARALATITPRAALPVKHGGRTELVRVEDILWAEAAGDYALLHAQSATHTARVTLRHLEGELERCGFLRVHRSALVRVSGVRSVAPLPKGEAMLTLTDGTEVRASRTYRDAIKAIGRGF